MMPSEPIGLKPNDPGIPSTLAAYRAETEIKSRVFLERLQDAICHHANRAGITMNEAAIYLANSAFPRRAR